MVHRSCRDLHHCQTEKYIVDQLPLKSTTAIRRATIHPKFQPTSEFLSSAIFSAIRLIAAATPCSWPTGIMLTFILPSNVVNAAVRHTSQGSGHVSIEETNHRRAATSFSCCFLASR